MKHLHWMGFTAAAFVAIAAQASPIVTVGNYTLAPGATLTIPLNVSDTAAAAAEDIEGMSFTVQLNNGIGSTPMILNVDLLSGTVWVGHSAIVTTPSGGNLLQFQSRSVMTGSAGDFISANGLLGSITFDATSAATGSYTILLVGTLSPANDSQFQDGLGEPVSATFGQGTLTVAVPEPACLSLLGLGGMMLWRRSRKS